ncbi:hypothetical protein [Staphylococcus cohnii]|uniref:hypothetical protein n=1 Tax=Staphylococcus cohnii TaxID=29382 RepID=UPI003AD45196
MSNIIKTIGKGIGKGVGAAGLGILGSYFKRTFTIKGPLGKEITRIIENHFSEPVEIKA